MSAELALAAAIPPLGPAVALGSSRSHKTDRNGYGMIHYQLEGWQDEDFDRHFTAPDSDELDHASGVLVHVTEDSTEMPGKWFWLYVPLGMNLTEEDIGELIQAGVHEYESELG